jgi:hypothetical protein
MAELFLRQALRPSIFPQIARQRFSHFHDENQPA